MEDRWRMPWRGRSRHRCSPQVRAQVERLFLHGRHRGSPVLIITGPPGAGKSTVAASVAQHSSTAACVEADWFWTTIVGRFIDPWPAADAQNRTVLRSAFYAARAFEDGGYDTVVEDIVGPWMLDVVADTLRDSSPVDYVVLRPSLTSCLSRAARRPAVERVPGYPPPLDRSGPIRQMWARFSDLGRLESHAVDTSTMSEDETVRAVLEARHDGRLRVELSTPRS